MSPKSYFLVEIWDFLQEKSKLGVVYICLHNDVMCGRSDGLYHVFYLPQILCVDIFQI